MKVQIWDILAILLLLAALAVVAVVGSIFMDPYSSLNPFPPPQVPALLVIPSSTSVPLRMPPTWTPVGFSGTASGTDLASTVLPSSTPLPTATGIVLPSGTNTGTPTNTSTATRTVTPTPTATKINFTATYYAIQTQVWHLVTHTAQAAMTQTAGAIPTATRTANPLPTATRTATSAAPPPP
jgi:hypothetical protein